MNIEGLHVFLIGSGLAVIVLIFLLIIQIVIMRTVGYFAQKKRNKVINVWRPFLVQAALEEQNEIPTYKGNEWRCIAEEWNKMIGILRGGARENLIALAWKLDLHQQVRRLLYGKGTKNRLFAIVTLGHMRAAVVWPDLVQIMNSNRATVSLIAAQALIQIHAERALKHIMPLLEMRSDWHWAGVAHILRLVDSNLICPRLEQCMAKASEDRIPGLLRLMETLNCSTNSMVIGQVLHQSDNDKIISTCMHIVNNPDAINDVRRHIAHPRWHVRMHAAAAMGRLGLQEDIPVLVKCLQDREWWVRYRAAQSLVGMPFINAEEITEIFKTLADPYARDILQHVISERKYHAL